MITENCYFIRAYLSSFSLLVFFFSFGGASGEDPGKDKRKGGKDELGAPIKGQTAFVVQPGQVDMVCAAGSRPGVEIHRIASPAYVLRSSLSYVLHPPFPTPLTWYSAPPLSCSLLWQF